LGVRPGCRTRRRPGRSRCNGARYRPAATPSTRRGALSAPAAVQTAPAGQPAGPADGGSPSPAPLTEEKKAADGASPKSDGVPDRELNPVESAELQAVDPGYRWLVEQIVAGRWVAAGPTNIPGRATGLARPANWPGQILVADADGGLWLTRDSGASGEPLTEREATPPRARSWPIRSIPGSSGGARASGTGRSTTTAAR